MLFIDEIHRLPRAVEEVLYPAMEDFALDLMMGKGPSARSIRIPLQPFTLIGATTRSGQLSSPLRDRFGMLFRLELYTPEELAVIVTNSAGRLSMPITADGAAEIARRSRGTPRIANRFLRRVRDFAQVMGDGVVDGAIARKALTALNVDALGLDATDRRMLSTIAKSFGGGPSGWKRSPPSSVRNPSRLRTSMSPTFCSSAFSTARRGDAASRRQPTRTSACGRRARRRTGSNNWICRGKGMFISDNWTDYQLLDAEGGERLERWGDYVLIRPDPQVIWHSERVNPFWRKAQGIYRRSSSGGGAWVRRQMPDEWQITYRDLTFAVSPMGFKHTGIFPEQAVNWDYIAGQIQNAGREIRLLNLFAYTGGATVAAAKAGAFVCHVDASKGMVAKARQNASLSGIASDRIRYIVDDCFKFVAREVPAGQPVRRGHPRPALLRARAERRKMAHRREPRRTGAAHHAGTVRRPAVRHSQFLHDGAVTLDLRVHSGQQYHPPLRRPYRER